MNTDKTSASICVHLRSKNPVPHAPVSFRADPVNGQVAPATRNQAMNVLVCLDWRVESGLRLAPVMALRVQRPRVNIALAQINTTVGDLAGNEARILTAYRRGAEAGAEIVVTPELAVTGYPPRDLLLRPGFIEDNLRALESKGSNYNI